MIPVDWTKRQKPYIVDDVVYYRYTASIEESTVSSALKRRWNFEGLQELLTYYGRVSDSIPTSIVSSSLERLEYVLDPRPRCNIAYVLVTIQKEELDQIDFVIDDAILESEIVARSVELNTFQLDQNLEFVYSKLLSAENKQNRTSYVLYYNSIKQSRQTSRSMRKFFSSLFEILAENDIEIDYNREDRISIFFTDDFRVVAITFNGDLVKVGSNSLERRIGFSNSMINDLVFNFSTLVSDSRIEIISDNDSRWIEFYKRNLTGSFFVSEDRGRKLRAQMAEEYSIDEILRRSFVDGQDLKQLNDSVTEALENEIDRRMQFRVLDIDNCADVQATEVIRFYKNVKEKEFEDALIDNPAIRATYTERTFKIADFVGDEILEALLEGNILDSATDIGDIYQLIFNLVNVDVLVTKVLRCIAQDIDFSIPKICIDVFNPLTIPLPDLSNFTGIFDFISDLVRKALLTAVSELLQTFLQYIFDILDECARLSEQGEKIYEMDRSPQKYFDGEEQLAIDQMFDRIKDLYEDLDSAKGIASDQNLSQFLQDVVAALTPVEFCRLVSGNANPLILDVVLCIIESRYPAINEVVKTREEVGALFSSLSFILDTSICDALIDEIPTEDDICLTNEQIDFRGVLLAEKQYDPSLIDEQLNKVRKKRQEQIKFAQDILGGNLSDKMFGELSPTQFVLKAIPPVSDNAPARHMVDITVDATIDPIRDSFENLTLAPGGMKETLPEFLSSEITNNFNASGFATITPTGVRFNSNRFSIDLNLEPEQDVFVLGTNTIEAENKRVEYPSRKSAFNDLVEYDALSNSGLYDRVLSRCIIEIKRDILNFPSNFNSNEFFNRAVPITSPPKIFENCWQDGTSVRTGIKESFYEKEKNTKNPVDLMNATIEGLTRLLIQSFVLDYVFKNLSTISKFRLDSFNDKFINKYLEVAIDRYYPEISEAFDIFVSDDDKLSTFIARQLGDTYNQISFVLTADSVKDRFFDKFSVVNGDVTPTLGNITLDLSNFIFRRYVRNINTGAMFNPDNLPDGLLNLGDIVFDYEWVLQFRFKDQQRAGAETVLLEVTREYEQEFPSDMFDELVNSDEASILFDYALPLETIVAALSIYIVELFNNRDNYFELKELLRVVLVNTINLLEFEFQNEEVDQFVRNRKKQSFRGQ